MLLPRTVIKLKVVHVRKVSVMLSHYIKADSREESESVMLIARI